MVDCPYDKREDNGGKLIRKDKAKSFPNKNNFTKKTPPKGLVAQEEYNEDMMMMKTVRRLPWPPLPLRQLHIRPLMFINAIRQRRIINDGSFDVGGYLVGGFSHEALGGDVLVG